MITARSPRIKTNQLCQAGLSASATSTYTRLINSYSSVFDYNYLYILSGGASTSRKKRSTLQQTCTTLNNLGSPGISSLSSDSLATLSSSDFIACETLLGLAANSWSSAQLSTLYSLSIKVYELIIIKN
jgi:hypothetical protein